MLVERLNVQNTRQNWKGSEEQLSEEERERRRERDSVCFNVSNIGAVQRADVINQ